ncbi:hypothetical protein CA12_28630 [Alienimonas californiensis]|uniref:Uncharacterized protein n=2 Tax=Alienimonas californiensis TaxID=2527989 RepID=A0A517PBM1_9PLAN|nr:hypothetical protein CA12_28630 [Alienimonas californiensis]
MLAVAGLTAVGCKATPPEITAVALSPNNMCEPEGIPFYLPKALLVVSKNFRSIEESKVGLTSSAPIPGHFDDQSKYGDINSRTAFSRVTSGSSYPTVEGDTTTITTGNHATAGAPVLHSRGAPVSPGQAPSDGLTPDTFFTYHIMFVPDLSQKYGLKIRGGAGEFRAAMQMVNGWQFTGLGPFYMKDSSSAQNGMAGGIASNLALGGAADVVNSVTDLAGELGKSRDGVGPNDGRTVTVEQAVEVFGGLAGCQPVRLDGFAEIHIFEQRLDDVTGQSTWAPVIDLQFYRDMLGLKVERVVCAPAVTSDTARGGTPEPKDNPQTRNDVVPVEPAPAPVEVNATAINVMPPPAPPKRHRLFGDIDLGHWHPFHDRPSVIESVRIFPPSAADRLTDAALLAPASPALPLLAPASPAVPYMSGSPSSPDGLEGNINLGVDIND